LVPGTKGFRKSFLENLSLGHRKKFPPAASRFIYTKNFFPAGKSLSLGHRKTVSAGYLHKEFFPPAASRFIYTKKIRLRRAISFTFGFYISFSFFFYFLYLFVVLFVVTRSLC